MPSEHANQILKEMEATLARAAGARANCAVSRRLNGVNFCSNDYLGLAEDPRLKKAVMEAVESAARVGGTGSRLLSGHERFGTNWKRSSRNLQERKRRCILRAATPRMSVCSQRFWARTIWFFPMR